MTHRPRAGMTLLEVAAAAFFLALLSAPTLQVITGAGRSVQRTDARRETRHLLRQVLERIEAADFLVLYDNFGVEPDSSNRMVTGIGDDTRNPLLLTKQLRERMDELGWEVSLRFRFMTRDELGVDPDNPMRSDTGILHLQGAHIELTVDAPGRPRAVVKKPLYCPLILGRPGLMVSQCPALNPGLQRDLFARIP